MENARLENNGPNSMAKNDMTGLKAVGTWRLFYYISNPAIRSVIQSCISIAPVYITYLLTS